MFNKKYSSQTVEYHWLNMLTKIACKKCLSRTKEKLYLLILYYYIIFISGSFVWNTSGHSIVLTYTSVSGSTMVSSQTTPSTISTLNSISIRVCSVCTTDSIPWSSGVNQRVAIGVVGAGSRVHSSRVPCSRNAGSSDSDEGGECDDS